MTRQGMYPASLHQYQQRHRQPLIRRLRQFRRIEASATSASQINLSWTASTDNVGVTGYKVYRNGTQIATATTTSYSNTGLAASTAYTYTVSAYDAAGNVSGQSASVSATTQASNQHDIDWWF